MARRNPKLIHLIQGDRVAFDPRGFVLEPNSFSVESQTILELTKRDESEAPAFSTAKQAIAQAIAAMGKVKFNRETSLAKTKLQEAQHWLESEPGDAGMDHRKS